VINEDLAVLEYGEKAEELEKILRRQYGLTSKNFDELLQQSGKNYKTYFEKLRKLHDEKASKPEPDQDIDLSKSKPLPDIEDRPKKLAHRDEQLIDILEYLEKYWKNKDRVRVFAARIKIDPELYMVAGLGKLPDNYTDEDIWNTMDASKKGKIKFVDSTWQPLYIKTMDLLQQLPEEVKDEITELLYKPRTHTYPVTAGGPERKIRENRYTLIYDIIINEDNIVRIIPAGSIILRQI